MHINHCIILEVCFAAILMLVIETTSMMGVIQLVHCEILIVTLFDSVMLKKCCSVVVESNVWCSKMLFAVFYIDDF